MRLLLTALAVLLAACAPAGGEPAPAASEPGELGTPLLRSAAAGDVPAVRALLSAGGDPDVTDRTGATPLVVAAYRNQVAVARELVEAGADVNHMDRTRQSAYLIATSEVGDDPRLLDLVLAHGADVRSLDSYQGTGLIRAAERGFPTICRRLQAAGVPVDHVNRLGWTALHEAIILGDGGPDHVATVRALVRGGADVNLRSRADGVTPLAHAEAKGFEQIAEILRAAGAAS